ncbi:uncharacterized protein LOC132471215 isoform X1 [Gadus macrocephalus]|uniref:uncharacterized protein LOC132471215 isoform X1 n=2 Tax=Gadus macrocephalus TaxID=80720 RepID=UPI0028CB5C96|nr:uncharacterized protein LOC132471215 isoform X1 [Gadus macrocephalus]
MKKGTLHFLGRKKQSLFDTNNPVKIQTMENGLSQNMDLMSDSSAIPDTGTAKVRPRPTVKHHTSSSESVYGVAVPTPTVPIFSTFNGLKEGDRLSIGSATSLNDPIEGNIFVPPPPSVAPPPPPTQFILPPPDFMGELDSPNRAMIQRPSMPPPKPPSEPPALQDLTLLRPPPMTLPKPPSEPPALQDLTLLRPPPMTLPKPPSEPPALQDLTLLRPPPMTPPKPPSEPPALQDLTLLRPPPMTPPKPPSTYSSASTPISTPPPGVVPELPDCPRFAPPKPPSEKPKKPGKAPPPKPTRLSSIAGADAFVEPYPPAASHQMNTPSSFNPQNNAKLYNAPKTSIVSGQGDFDPRPKPILLLQPSSPDAVQVDGKASPTPPSTPSRGAGPAETQLDREPKMNPQANITAKTAQSQPKPEAKPVISSLQEKDLAPSLPPVSTKSSKELSTQDLFKVSHKGNYSPLIDRKLRNLKGPETSGSSTSPFALLQAAKEREKHRSPKTSFKHRHSSPNSFVVTPRSNSISTTTHENGLEEDSRSTYSAAGPMSTAQTQPLHLAPPSARSPAAPSTPAFGGSSTAGTSPSLGRLASEKQEVKQASPSLDYRKSEANPPETPMTLLPPPPEFSNFNFNDIMDLPPDFPPPDPPKKKAPVSIIKPVYAAPAPPPKPASPAPSQAPTPAPPPKPKSAAPALSPPPPPAPAPVPDVKPLVYQTLPRLPVQKPLPDVSESQATLLSILQKKMKEMDSKISPKREMESSNDEWGSPMSDEDTMIPFTPRTTPQNNKNYMLPTKNASLDMRELETKVAKKQQDNASASSSETKSKQHGMTITVRPGTKQPITVVSKGEPAQAL